MTTETFVVPGAAKWISPFTGTVQVELWGAGGAGGGNNTTSDGGGGGGGGGYGRLDAFAVLNATTYDYNVGTLGAGVATTTGGSGGATWWVSALTFQAPGGIGGSGAFNPTTPRAAGAGGTSFVGVFSATTNGGAGGAGVNNNSGGGGGGGGSGGNTTGGGTGAAGTAGAGGAGGAAGTTNGGIGGVGGSGTAAGIAPVSGNGGGGGGSGEGVVAGGNGAVGKVILTYTIPAPLVIIAAHHYKTMAGA